MTPSVAREWECRGISVSLQFICLYSVLEGPEHGHPEAQGDSFKGSSATSVIMGLGVFIHPSFRALLFTGSPRELWTLQWHGWTELLLDEDFPPSLTPKWLVQQRAGFLLFFDPAIQSDRQNPDGFSLCTEISQMMVGSWVAW